MKMAGAVRTGGKGTVRRYTATWLIDLSAWQESLHLAVCLSWNIVW